MLYRGDREAGRGTELKHTHFTTPPPPSTPFSFTQRYLTPSLSPLKNPLFFPTENMQGGEEEERRRKKNASEATRERERKQRKLVVEREGEERGVDQMEGRKEGKDLSKGSSA